METTKSSPATTPMMAQWQSCKKKAKGCVLFFRMGDFYEAFYEDAKLLAEELDLTLTKRQNVPMSGVPYHACDSYIDRLIAKGYRVAIAEQIEDPKKAIGLVKRDVVRILSPGTLLNSNLLQENSNNYFACVLQVGQTYGLSIIDITTGYFAAIEFDRLKDLFDELYRLRPSEILTSKKFYALFLENFNELKFSFNFLLSSLEDWKFAPQNALDFLTNHFDVHNLDGFGLRGMTAAISASGASLIYLQDHLCHSIDHIQSIATYQNSQFLMLDRITLQNLELTDSKGSPEKAHTLLSVLDHTKTPMGARRIRNWVKQPLINIEEIKQRQDAIKSLLESTLLLNKLEIALKPIRDLERLMIKISSGYASPKDLIILKNSLKAVPKVKDTLKKSTSNLLKTEAEKLKDLQSLTLLLDKALLDDPPLKIGDGKTFKNGFDEKLDEWLKVSQSGKSWIAEYQKTVREETNIKTLKIGYNRVFGYYIEVSRGQADKMPSSFQRRQTLTNSERFISPELKEYESKVLVAEEKIREREAVLFQNIKETILSFDSQVRLIANAISVTDCIYSLTVAANIYNYVAPVIDDSDTLTIIEGRYPVIEATQLTQEFIPNDTQIGDDTRLAIITGPNMSGKSTYIRQVALIIILAQMGSFVPCTSAHIGVVDKIFTRIGASDDLIRGQSTFMVEMTETANILNNTTSKSLVILDEIGRGTSTYDGISIAWAVADYLLTEPNKTPKTLFATHYFELTELADRIKQAKNYTVKVQEIDQKVIFLHKIIEGSADRSYGIHVAQIAGIPQKVISKAKEILHDLESKKHIKYKSHVKKERSSEQLLLFPKEVDPNDHKGKQLLNILKNLDINQLTPVDALVKLQEIKSLL